MYKIIKKRYFNDNAVEMTVEAPLVAAACRPGQFIILRADKDGERIPLTIVGCDAERGAITLLIQTVGYSTIKLGKLCEGDEIEDLLGPLGNPTELGAFDSVLLVAGGIGSAVILPQARHIRENQAADGKKNVDIIIGGRGREFLTYETELSQNSDNLYVMTDDGSKGGKGFVTDKIRELFDGGKKYDVVFAVGPMPMMRAVVNLTKEYGVRTLVSMNTIMVDGTGMCGGCRLTVGGETKYACVDGPEFDGAAVDFDEAINRAGFYKETERLHKCRFLES
ncbi:MAG: sulfide/dihydroorotate dehydrogenase-like FAD/NAD-binding protein [Clostridiales bacterium]|jgi:ferredoxin--NADP+ reductase|nr:sulfide/dihydroorotate dehydrogenase-like FAD/NAD-binding protein [Clostridiales bacterium]